MKEYMAEEVLVALRRIMRATDLHSRGLIAAYGLTVPQLVVLRELAGGGMLPVGVLSRRVHLSSPTVANILGRLLARGFIVRERSPHDRRSVLVGITEEGRRKAESAPGLLQDHFVERFEKLEEWEQTQVLATLQRVALMMDAEDIDAAPLLSVGSIEAPPTHGAGGRGEGPGTSEDGG